jgi:ABC-type amino acid transport substrate-binding protein
MASGRLDLSIADSIAVDDGFLKTDAGEEFEFVGPSFSDPEWFGDGAGVAVRKGQDKLRMAINDAIKQIRTDGTYKKINDKYFEFDVFGE